MANNMRDIDGRYLSKGIDAELVIRLYKNDGLSSNVIGSMLGVTGMTIRRRLHKAGVLRNAQNNHDERHSHWKGGLAMREGYMLVMRKGHPRADRQGYVNRSILAWEEDNGMSFPPGMEPHHKNGIRDDDRPENIEPKTHSKHTKEHNERRHGKNLGLSEN